MNTGVLRRKCIRHDHVIAKQLFLKLPKMSPELSDLKGEESGAGYSETCKTLERPWLFFFFSYGI